jgi:hypothetical protein
MEEEKEGEWFRQFRKPFGMDEAGRGGEGDMLF